MADINLRFYKDMLVLSAPVLPALQRFGIDVARDTEITLLLEPDTYEEAYRLEWIAGAQCFVTCTEMLTPARLAHIGMENSARELAHSALSVLKLFKPQHVLVEIGSCGLPLDGSSQASLKENFNQYERAGRLFEQEEFDAFFLNGFKTSTNLKCALMGLRAVSDRPIFASVDVQADGMLASGRETLEQAAAVMNEYGAQVAGFATAAPQKEALVLADRLAACTNLPLLVQIVVPYRDTDDHHRQHADNDIPYETADSMMEIAEAMYAKGVQFLRAAGNATPAYTGALVAASAGLDVCISENDETEPNKLPDAEAELPDGTNGV